MTIFRSGVQVFFHLLKGTNGLSLDKGILINVLTLLLKVELSSLSVHFLENKLFYVEKQKQ